MTSTTAIVVSGHCDTWHVVTHTHHRASVPRNLSPVRMNPSADGDVDCGFRPRRNRATARGSLVRLLASRLGARPSGRSGNDIASQAGLQARQRVACRCTGASARRTRVYALTAKRDRLRRHRFPREVIAAIRELRASPDLYRAMVANASRRGAEFSVASTKDRWLRFLQSDVVPDALEWRNRNRAFDPGRVAQIGRMSRQKLATKWFKLRVSREWNASSCLRATESGP
jgi:hypothetical protein